ncbi:MAG: hypothetical protein J6W16_01400 [Methanobrevibacter sp.]|nr:hypothetical protein [Methanobrevibacter sp.]
MTTTKKHPLRCTNCGSQDLCYLEDETYCRKCGLVLQGVPSIDHYIFGYIIGGKRSTSFSSEDLE